MISLFPIFFFICIIGQLRMKNFMVIVALIVIGGGVWFGLKNFYTPVTNTKQKNSNANGNVSTDVSRAWDTVVAQAVDTQDFPYSGFTFAIPKNMTKSEGAGAVSWSFPVSYPDSPSLLFMQHEFDSAVELVQSIKATLPAGQRIVREGSEQIHEQQWRYIEVTTNVGYSMTYWYSDHRPTVEIEYNQGRGDVMAILDKVVKSAVVQ